MALKRVTMQDIADACGLSRNTVSKIFNGRGAVPEATQKMVLSKAKELGYGQIPEESSANGKERSRNIALLTQHKLLSHNFGAFFITSFTDAICRLGYTMKMYEVSPDELREKRLPPHLKLEETAAVLCIELFDSKYLEMVSSLGLPCVFVDGNANASKDPMRCDVISMENYAAVIRMTKQMIRAGARRIGFVGDKDHCNSFSERWLGYRVALIDEGLPLDSTLCILEPDSDNYGDAEWLVERLRAMPFIPDGFVCANDYLAIHLMAALKKCGLRIPEDVMVAGFDGSPEAGLVDPPLTTAQIPSAEIGRLAASLLIQRIASPDRPFVWTNVHTTAIWGGTTRE